MIRLLAWLLAGCALAGAAAAQTLLDFSAEERARIAAHGPWPPAREPDHSNPWQDLPAAVALGRMLFADAGLSRDGTLSCASCHRPALAFQDGRAVAQGLAAGRRNTPGLLDVAQLRWFGWDGAHDSLWSASLAPLLDRTEMGATLQHLAGHVRGEARLRRAWRTAFGTPLGSDDEAVAVGIARALAAFQATLVSPRTPFDDFRDALLRGDHQAAARYPLDAQRGLRLFIGAANCHLCHAGPLFSHGEFADIGRPFFLPGGGVDPGRHGGVQKLRADPYNRLGRHGRAATDPRALLTRQVEQLHRHFGEFRVPGLRQLAYTAPYMHDGSLATIEDVVQHYSALSEERLHTDGERILRRLDLSPQQAADLAAFLRSLGR